MYHSPPSLLPIHFPFLSYPPFYPFPMPILLSPSFSPVFRITLPYAISFSTPLQILDVDDSKSLDFTEVLSSLLAADAAGPMRFCNRCPSSPLTTNFGVFLVSFAVSVASLAVRAPVLHRAPSLCSGTYI